MSLSPISDGVYQIQLANTLVYDPLGATLDYPGVANSPIVVDSTNSSYLNLLVYLYSSSV